LDSGFQQHDGEQQSVQCHCWLAGFSLKHICWIDNSSGNRNSNRWHTRRTRMRAMALKSQAGADMTPAAKMRSPGTPQIRNTLARAGALRRHRPLSRHSPSRIGGARPRRGRSQRLQPRPFDKLRCGATGNGVQHGLSAGRNASGKARVRAKTGVKLNWQPYQTRCRSQMIKIRSPSVA
jgi:hypothetical protein